MRSATASRDSSRSSRTRRTAEPKATAIGSGVLPRRGKSLAKAAGHVPRQSNRRHMSLPPDMSTSLSRVVGIDLGGARMRTTGVVVLEGTARPVVVEAGVLPRAATADLAERQLLAFIERVQPATVAIDAPLTLPPCLCC